MFDGAARARVTLNQDFPAGLDRLWAVLGRREYVERKYTALGSSALRILRFEASDELIEVELERRAPARIEGLPAWARLVPGRGWTLRQHTRWQRVGPGRVDVGLDLALAGGLVRATGVGAVAERSPALTRMTLDIETACEIPGIGAEAARLFADEVGRALREDHVFTVEYLTGCARASQARDAGAGRRPD
ncbi:MAG TPA: DUF2505 domain-containing protein [Quisquiliibacterium sp.]|nr:DUF2505 domain-containing protein [Quisquiliibacterium sp.]